MISHEYAHYFIAHFKIVIASGSFILHGRHGNVSWLDTLGFVFFSLCEKEMSLAIWVIPYPKYASNTSHIQGNTRDTNCHVDELGPPLEFKQNFKHGILTCKPSSLYVILS
jgi:hypothetical protein